MPKASLTLLGASLSLNAETVRTALASECELSETDLDAACKALFELKVPYVVCKEVELAVAANHFGQLKALGIDCEVEVLDLSHTNESSTSNVLRNCVVASVCALCASAGYYLYSQKANSQSAIVEAHNVQPQSTIEIAVETELTEFYHWRNRLNEIENLKRKLDDIPSERFKAELIASVEDPLVRIVGTNYVAQSAIQMHESGGQKSRIAEHQKTLEASAVIIDKYPAPLDRFYASLDLAGVYQQLRHHDAVQSAFRLAENRVPEDELNQRAQIVIAQVALAEYQHLYGQPANRDVHLETAMAAVNGLEDNLQQWAHAYIARVEAKFGMFTKAHRRLKTVDKRIVDVVMVDISRYAARKNNEPSFEIPDLTSREFLQK